MRLALVTLLTILFYLPSHAFETVPADTTGKKIFGGATATAKKIAAKHEFNERNYRGALVVYREVIELSPNDAEVYQGIAESYFELKKYALAEKNLQKAISLDPSIDNEVDFFYGRIYHHVADLDNAIARYQKFLANNKSDYRVGQTKLFIKQCEYAKVQMKNPVPVNIENVGREVNSRYEDYAPSITADGSMLVFTSRRNTTTGGKQDTEGDYKFFEDVLYSTFDGVSWSEAEPIEGLVNTESHDAVLSIHPNGNEIFIYRNSEKEAADIFLSTYNAEAKNWGTPQRLPRPINTSYFEGSVSVTADGETLYFISERPGGLGRGDIYRAKKKGSSWSDVESLGPIVNTVEDEKFVFIHPDGKTLFFASEGHQSMGSYDIFKTEYINGQWSAPLNLGYPINTVNEESTFSLTADNKTMFLSAEYEGGVGERDIYKLDVSNYAGIRGSEPGTTSGTLYLNVRQDGQEVKKKEVQIIDPINDAVIMTGETDKKGAVQFVLPEGKEYRIVIERRKKDPISQSVTLELKDGSVEAQRRNIDL